MTEQAESFQPITDRVKQIWALFEGECPDCGQDIAITRVGGRASWLEQNPYDGDHEVDEIEPGTYNPDGFVEFKCPSGHKHYTESRYGDWS